MGSRVALIIGNSLYDDPTLARLNAPGADVRALAALLGDPTIGQFDSVRALIDEHEAPTRRAIAGFFATARPDDLLLLYFSGHGVLDDQGRLYLAARDTQHDLPQGSAIPAAFITDGMDSSRSRRQVLILDCCHSGAFARGARGTAGAKAVTAATFEGLGYGRVVLTATDSTQYAWEGDAVFGAAEHSVFTQHLIDGLATGSADTDGDGEITIEELYDYVYGQVVRQTPRQTPRKWSYNQEGALIVARNPRPPQPAVTPLPDELQQSVDDARSWVRKGAVQELSRLLTQNSPGRAAAARAALEHLAESDDSFSVRAAARTALGPATSAPATPPVEAVDAQPSTAAAPVKLQPRSVPDDDQPAPQAARPHATTAPAAMAAAPAIPGARRAILALMLGWAAAFFLGTATFWMLYQNTEDVVASRAPELVVFGLVGGAATLIGLRLARPEISALPGIWVVLPCLGLAVLGNWISPALQANGISVHASLAWERALLGTLGGVLLAGLLAWKRWLSRDGALRVAGGWALAWIVGPLVGLGLYGFFGDSPIDGLSEVLSNTIGWDLGSVLLPWVDSLFTSIIGLIAGGLAGWVLVRELNHPLTQIVEN